MGKNKSTSCLEKMQESPKRWQSRRPQGRAGRRLQCLARGGAPSFTARVKASCEECAGCGGQEDSGSPPAPARTRLSTQPSRSPPCLSALCPNAVTQQHLAALRYLCYKRLVEVRGPGQGGGSSEQGLLSAPGAADRKAHTGVHFCREACPRRAGLSWCR